MSQVITKKVRLLNVPNAEEESKQLVIYPDGKVRKQKHGFALMLILGDPSESHFHTIELTHQDIEELTNNIDYSITKKTNTVNGHFHTVELELETDNSFQIDSISDAGDIEHAPLINLIGSGNGTITNPEPEPTPTPTGYTGEFRCYDKQFVVQNGLITSVSQIIE